jgi:GTP cyclohydrolase I
MKSKLKLKEWYTKQIEKFLLKLLQYYTLGVRVCLDGYKVCVKFM